MRILGIAGSLRRDSHNRALLRAAAELLPEGVELVVFDGLREVEAFDEDAEAWPPAGASALREALDGVDAVLFATPEYNGTIPGQLKNAVDWASRPAARGPLAGKPVAVIGASTGMFGAVWAQADLRKALGLVGARVVDAELPVAAAHEAFGPDGGLADAELERALAALLAELVAAADARAAARAA